MTRRQLSLVAEATTPGAAGAERMVDLVGRVLAFQPLGVETIETKRGPAEALFVYVIEPAPDTEAGYVDHGEQPIFWSMVRAQLADRTSDETPWVVGRIEKLSQAYALRAVSPDEHAAAIHAIKAWALVMAEAQESAAQAGDEPF
ncbi:MAG TPA: hypothetical protein VFC99_05785 [Acidimicrobiia bacterium]|nr:hypothetical protein [Acidimicrobiia bacterium]